MMIGFIVQVYKYFIRYTYLFMGKTCGYMIITYDITQLMLGRLEWEQVANKYEIWRLCPHCGSIRQPAYSFKLMTMSSMIHCVHMISLTLNIDQQELGECPRRSCSGILGHSVLSQHFQPQSKPKPKPRPSCTSTRYQCWPRLMPWA